MERLSGYRTDQRNGLPREFGPFPAGRSYTSCIGHCNAGISIGQNTNINIMLQPHYTFSASFEEGDLGEFPHASTYQPSHSRACSVPPHLPPPTREAPS